MSEGTTASWNRHAYEAVLGVPFNADYIAPTIAEPEYDVVDVRKFAHDVVMDAVKRFSSREYAGEDVLFNPSEARHVAIAHEIIGDDFSLLRRHVRMADNLAAAQNTLQVEEYERPTLQARANYQFATIRGIIDSLQRLRLPHNEVAASIQELLRLGVIAVAPTGFGKTFVGAHVLRAAGVGRKVSTAGEPLNALVVVPSIDLVHQYTRDDNNIFRQVIGYDVPIGKYWSYDKDIKPVTVMTKRSLSLALERGDIDRGQFGLLLFDEVHHATSPQTFEALQKITSGMVGLTATPAYNERKDVRKWFPHLRTGSLRQFAEEGILSPARLLTLRESETQSAEDIAVSLAIEYVAEGRQAIVYTRKGNNSMQARVIAARINEVLGENTACAIGHFVGAKGRTDPIEAYRDGSIRVLTTSRMLLEGFDGPVDGMITIGPHYSKLDLTQKAGRAMRHGRFEALLAEILPRNAGTDMRMVSLPAVFGIDNFMQGMYVGPAHKASVNKTGHASFVEELPIGIQTLLVETQKLREIYVGPDMDVSQHIAGDQILLTELAEMYQTHEQHIETILSKAGITGIGITVKSGQTCELMTWYGTEAIAYLDEHPPQKIPDEAFMSPAEIIELTGVSRTYLDNLRKKYGFELHPRLVSKNRTIGFFDKETTAMILEIIEDIPFAEIDDVPIGSMSPEIAATFLLAHCEAQSIPIALKRRNEEHGLKGFAMHLSAADAAQVRKAYRELTQTDDLVPFNEIANRAEIAYASVKVNLTPEELNAVTRCYVRSENEKRRMAYHLPQDIANRVIERLGPKELPVGVLSVKGIQLRLKRGSSSVHNYIGALGDGHEPLIGNFKGQPGSRAAYYSWETLAAIEQRVSLPKAALPIDFTRLTNAALTEPHNRLYAQILQSYYMDTVDDSLVFAVNDVAAALQCSNWAYAMILARLPGVVESARYKSGEQTLRIAKQVLPIVAIVPPPRVGFTTYGAALQVLVSQGFATEKAAAALGSVTGKDVLLAKEHGIVGVYFSGDEVNRIARRLAKN